MSQAQLSASTREASRRSVVRLLLCLSLGASALAVSACTPGRPARDPNSFPGGGGNDKDRGGRS